MGLLNLGKRVSDDRGPSPLADMVNNLQEQRRLLINQLNKIELLARRHSSPASNPGAHALAAAIVKICEEQ